MVMISSLSYRDTIILIHVWPNKNGKAYDQYFKHEFKNKHSKDILELLSTNETLIVLYPFLSKFSQIALTLPVSNADAERGFSCMNRVKTERRNRLTVSSLDTLLRISMEGPEKDFDFDAAISKWSALRNR